jgi:hypothetical protein
VTVLEVAEHEDGNLRVKLDQTLFYPTGGQPHDTGTLAGCAVENVTKDGADAWHLLPVSPDNAVPAVGDKFTGILDWDRRHKLMRTHTALHVLCGVTWNRWQVPVTGGNMDLLSAHMDFAFDPLPEGFAQLIPASVQQSGSLTLWVSISRPMGAPMSAARPKLAASLLKKPSQKARATSASGSALPTQPDLARNSRPPYLRRPDRCRISSCCSCRKSA